MEIQYEKAAVKYLKGLQKPAHMGTKRSGNPLNRSAFLDGSTLGI